MSPIQEEGVRRDLLLYDITVATAAPQPRYQPPAGSIKYIV
jgi:hypothetical protein